MKNSKTHSKNVDLNDFKWFVAVVQAGSLSKAAELLNVPKSHLSRHLNQLESTLGTTLLDRGRKGVVLNELGERFYHNAQAMLKSAQIAIDEVQENLESPHGLLKISVSTEIAQEFLLPLCPLYLQQNPYVNLCIQLENKKINMIQDGIDIAFRLGDIGSDTVVAKKLCDIHLGLFAHPSYLAQHTAPQTPHELYAHQLIGKYDAPAWAFSQNGTEVVIGADFRFLCNDFGVVRQMLGHGTGIAMLPLFKTMQTADLVPVLSDWHIKSVPLYAVYYKNRGASSTVRSLIDFLWLQMGLL